MSDPKLTRINKFLSEIGFCSRREADKLIEQGRVKINGEVPLMGTKITNEDKVSVNGKVVHRHKKKKMVYMNSLLKVLKMFRVMREMLFLLAQFMARIMKRILFIRDLAL